MKASEHTGKVTVGSVKAPPGSVGSGASAAEANVCVGRWNSGLPFLSFPIVLWGPRLLYSTVHHGVMLITVAGS